HGPRLQDAVDLQAEVVVQRGRGVLLDHEDRRVTGRHAARLAPGPHAAAGSAAGRTGPSSKRREKLDPRGARSAPARRDQISGPSATAVTSWMSPNAGTITSTWPGRASTLPISSSQRRPPASTAR